MKFAKMLIFHLPTLIRLAKLYKSTADAWGDGKLSKAEWGYFTSESWVIVKALKPDVVE